MRLLATILCLSLMTACGSNPSGPTTSLDREFVLAPGQTAFIEDEPATVTFVGVEGDSRCPVDAICIQGGDAIVRITVSSVAGNGEYELHTGSLAPVRHGALTISLVELLPYPFSSQTIAPGDYRPKLKVTR